MASELPMSPHLEQIHGEIRDHFRALANGFQRLDKIKDSSRQSKQLEELAEKMRDCKRYSLSPRYQFFYYSNFPVLDEGLNFS
jgi:hypothetical protein